MLKWDLTKLSTVNYETVSHEIKEPYHGISIITNTADIVFVAAEDIKHTVTCYEQSNVKHAVTVKDGALVIEVIDTSKWYEHIAINFGAPTITVSIPRGEYGALSISSNTGDVKLSKEFHFSSIDVSESTGDVECYASASEGIKIKATTGSVSVAGISAHTLDVSLSTGNIKLTDITCQSLVSSGSTGNITLKNVIAAASLSVERSTGDVKFDGCDAAEIRVRTTTGNVTGTLLSEKTFTASTSTGSVEVPKTSGGGRCEITTSTGNIRISLQQ